MESTTTWELCGGDEFTMDDKMLMELLALGIDAKMSVSLGHKFQEPFLRLNRTNSLDPAKQANSGAE